MLLDTVDCGEKLVDTVERSRLKLWREAGEHYGERLLVNTVDGS